MVRLLGLWGLNGSVRVPRAAHSFRFMPGPIHARVCNFGAVQDGPFAGALAFDGITPDALPNDVREALIGHIRAGDRVLLLSQHEAPMAWAEVQIAILTAQTPRQNALPVLVTRL